jgi:hypothetical protein
VGEAGRANEGEGGGDVHHGAAATFDHERNRVLHGQERALEVHPDDELEVLLGEFGQRPHGTSGSGVVKQRVQTAVGLAHLSHQAADAAGISHVERNGPAALREQRSGPLGAIQVGADDAGALLRQPRGDGGTRARTRTRHDGNLIVEPVHGLP